MITLFVLFAISPLSHNKDIDLPDIYIFHETPVKHTHSDIYAKVIMKMIKVYQVSFSSVQGDVCNFVPSCSHFGYNALKRYGLIKGLLLASDRLQRCHPGAWNYLDTYYTLTRDSIRGDKLFDPVENYK